MRPSIYLNRGSRILRMFNAAALADLSTGLISLPGWLTMVSAYTTVQTSDRTLKTGLAANTAKARNVAAGSPAASTGLQVASARTNALTSSIWTGTGWTNGAASVTAQSDPAGGTAAVRFNAVSNDFSNFSSAKSGRCASTWAKGISGVSPYGHIRHQSAGVWTDITSTDWQRYSLTNAANASDNMNVELRDVPSGAGVLAAASFACYGAQVEASVLYPGPHIPTSAGAVAVVTDTLVGSPAYVAPGGYFNLDFTIAPHYSQAEFLADHNIGYFDANNRIYIKQSDQTVRLRLGGSDVAASGSLTWAREDSIRVQAQHRRFGKRLTVSKNGVVVYESGLLSPASAITLPVSVGLLGDGTTTPECADLRALQVHRP